MLTEIRDIKRFAHPRQLMSWVGMGIFGSIPQLANTTVLASPSRAIVIYTQHSSKRTNAVTEQGRISKDLKTRRAHAAPELIDIADRCLRRLNKKGNRLLITGKHPNKIKIACAREMVGFVWESLNKVAA